MSDAEAIRKLVPAMRAGQTAEARAALNAMIEPCPEADGSPSLADRVASLADRVADLEGALDMIRATLLLNFGESAKGKYGITLDADKPTMALLIDVLEHFVKHNPADPEFASRPAEAAYQAAEPSVS